MMRERGGLTVVDLKHYAYCPRIVYFTHVLHLQEKETEAMSYGRELQEEVLLTPLIRLVKARRVEKDVELRSRTLPLIGKLDYLVTTKLGELIPVEVKWAEPTPKGKAKPDHRAQLAAYALMLDENRDTSVKRGGIYYRRASRLVIVPIQIEDKENVRRIVKTIMEMIEEEDYQPLRQKQKQCLNCGFSIFCRPV
ncbi:CRISPR-associated protein Cas4 [Candidatus Bathyarchaeota archaeon]|nr:CRISPR-associated protein Cas4 [Candidatus Bathyarchaeota archaeon]